MAKTEPLPVQDCPECGHRNREHIDGDAPCNAPRCPCPRGK